MSLEEARAALLAEILGEDIATANQDSSSEDQLNKCALQQIVNGCFVKLRKLKMFQCDACEKTFHKSSRLIIHYFDTHVNENLEEFDIENIAEGGAEKLSSDAVSENLHYGDVAKGGRGLRLHPCIICNESFAFKVDLKIHKLKHTGKEPRECEICLKLFTGDVALNTHIKEFHNANDVTCDVCNKTFDRLINLTKHKRRHTDVKPYSCEFCEKKFAHKGYLVTHRRSHTGDTPYTCSCGRQFPYYSGLKGHRCPLLTKKQMSEKELQCDYCKKKYQYRPSFINHIKCHMNARKYYCDICNVEFNSQGSVKRHRAKHTGDLPHKCSVCYKRFAVQYQLNRHMLTHTEKGYACEICDKRFATKYTLNTHLRVHRVKIYKCHVCEKKFDLRRKLNKHLKHCNVQNQTSDEEED